MGGFSDKKGGCGLVTAFMILMIGIMIAAVLMLVLVKLAGPQERRRNMESYAAVIEAPGPAECMQAFRLVLQDMTSPRGQSVPAKALPESDEECYKIFHHHYLPTKEKAFDSSSSFFSTGAAKELGALKKVDEKVAQVLRGEWSAPVSLPYLHEGPEPGGLQKLVYGKMPVWVAVLVVGSILAVVAGVFLYGFLVWKNFDIGLPPNYEYIMGEPRGPVIEELKARDPSERLINCFENRDKTRHLVSSDFTAPAGNILFYLPDTGDQAVMEAFVQERRSELAEEAAAQGMTVSNIKTLPLDSGHVTVWVSGKGTDVVNGSPAAVEMLTFRTGEHLVRIVLYNCGSGDLGAELGNVVKTARFE